MLGEKKEPEQVMHTNGQGKNKPVFAYFLSFMIASVMLVGGLAYAVNWWAKQDLQQQLGDAVLATAVSVASQVQATVDGKLDLADSLARSQQVIDLLSIADKGQRNIAAQQLVKFFPGALQAQLVSVEQRNEVLLEALPGSYVGKEMLLETMKSGTHQGVEALRDSAGVAHFITAAPVKDNEKLLGSLLVSYPMTLISKHISGLNVPGGGLALEQKVAGSAFKLAATGRYSPGTHNQFLPIKHTSWRVSHGIDPVAGGGLPMLAGMVILAALMLIGMLITVLRQLTQDIKADMGMTVTLVDATLKRTGMPSCFPRIQECTPAIESLTKYAQATYTAGKAAAARENVAGMPQMAVEEGASIDTLNLTEADVPEHIFSAGEIVGVIGDEMSLTLAQAIGEAVGTQVRAAGDKLVIGRDSGLHSAGYAEALVAGVLASGCDVVDLGAVPAALVHFALDTLSCRSAVIVGGGYAPVNYIGFQVVISDSPVCGQALTDLRRLILSRAFSSGAGNLESKDISAEYIRRVATDVQLIEPKKVVVDGGNGVAGPLMVRLLEALGCEVIQLFCQPDGNYPNHFPDPAQPENLSSLILEVQAQEADLGIALGIDGARIGVVDERGMQVSTDHLAMLLAGDIIRRHPGADVLFDVESTSEMAGFVLSSGGRPIMSESNACVMLEKVRETGALLGVMYAGHIFIKDRWLGFDDALYAGARMLEILASDALPVSEYFDDFPRAVVTPRMSVDIEAGQAEDLMREICANQVLSEADILDADGFRMEFSDGWVVMHASSAVPQLMFRFEAQDEAALNMIKEKMHAAVQQALPGTHIPF